MEEEEVDLMGWTPLFDKPMPDQGQMVYTTDQPGVFTAPAY